MVFFFPGGPTSAVLSSSASSGVNCGSGALTKSANDGPTFNLLLKDVADRARVAVLVVGGISLSAVANGLRWRHDGCTGRRTGSREERSLRETGLTVDMVVVCSCRGR